MKEELKKRWIYWMDKCLNIFFLIFGLFVIWLVCCIVGFSSFKIPTDSMEPGIIPGDYITVNKFIHGGRIFNLFEAAEKKPFKMRRMPAFGQLKRNDVVVFNFPFPQRWDSISFDLRSYYVKRCVALPGDTLEIEEARIRVRGYSGELGNVASQKEVAEFMKDYTGNARKHKELYIKGYPHDSVVNWNINTFGPLFIPAKGSQVKLDRFTMALYKEVIEWEQKKKISFREDRVWLENEPVESYTFQSDYYFVAGDRADNSQDSRYWGLLPDDFIVGKAFLIWKSVDPYTDKIRWKRVFKKIE